MLSGLGSACGGGDDGPGFAAGGPHKDAGQEDGGGAPEPLPDGDVPLPIDPPDAEVVPGDPPPALAGQPCAVDTNKLYALATLEAGPRPTQLAVDLKASAFGFAYVQPTAQCLGAVYLTLLSGASGVGKPETIPVSSECATAHHVSIAHTGEQWMFAISDERAGAADVSIVTYAGTGEPSAGARVTDTDAREVETALAPAGEGRVMLAYVDVDLRTGGYALHARALDGDGAPRADAVELEPAGEWIFSGLALQAIGERFVALGYRRESAAPDEMGQVRAEIVLDILDAETGERDREPRVLSDSAGGAGGIDLGTDAEGGGVMYSVGEGTSQQLWFQRLAPTGAPALVMSGLSTGGPAPPERIIGPPVDGTDPSLAKLPSGFAVAFRVLPRDPDQNGPMQAPPPRLRVYFLNRVGQTIADSDVALTLPYGGRSSIEAAYDGRITVGWSDTADDGNTTLTAAKLPCVGGL